MLFIMNHALDIVLKRIYTTESSYHRALRRSVATSTAIETGGKIDTIIRRLKRLKQQEKRHDSLLGSAPD